jgi:Cytochrome c
MDWNPERAVFLSAKGKTMRALTLLLIAGLGIGAAFTAYSQSNPSANLDPEGKRVFSKANCIGCHKWHGGGGGGYGGAALSLRDTQLDRDDIIKTVECGRPGTGMPYFMRGAYDEASKPCYGLDRQEAGKQIPMEAGTFLRRPDIEAVAAYVIDKLKGKKEVTYNECVEFWGDKSRMCDVYQKEKGNEKEGGGKSGG